MTLQRAYTA